MKTRVQQIQQGGNVQSVESRSVFVDIIELFWQKYQFLGGKMEAKDAPIKSWAAPIISKIVGNNHGIS